MENPKIDFIASVRKDRIDDIDSIVKSLEKLGCVIENVLSFSGVITGSASTDISLSDLKIDGIIHVEQDRKLKAIGKLKGSDNIASDKRGKV
jgi:hypothetical protein